MKKTALMMACMLAGISGAGAAAPVDQDFVTKAAQGGLAEVELGKLAADNGGNPKTKTFAQHMVDDHSKANESLKSAAASSGATVPSAPSKSQKATARRLGALKGSAFDTAYATTMVKDHKDTVALFEKESKSGHDSDLKAFATATLPTLKEHLQMAEGLK